MMRVYLSTIRILYSNPLNLNISWRSTCLIFFMTHTEWWNVSEISELILHKEKASSAFRFPHTFLLFPIHPHFTPTIPFNKFLTHLSPSFVPQP